MALAVMAGALWCSKIAAQSADDLGFRLQRAVAASTIDTASTKPWHLKLEVQLYNEAGKPSGTEALEEWWAADNKDKRVFSGQFAGTELRNEDGLFRSHDVNGWPYVAEQIRDILVHPLRLSDLADGTPELRKQTFSKVPLECIMLDQPIKGLKSPPLGLFPTYCLDPGKDSLRMSFEFGSELAVRNRIGKFQGVEIPVDLTLAENGVTAARAHVAALETFTPDAALFVPGPDVEKVKTGTARISSGVMQGQILTRGQPHYPESARMNHISGTVVLRAIIRRDGHIRTLQVMSSPDPDLAVAALAAVRQWTYKPYLLNGEPTEVDTTVVVNFNLNP
jgi:TonB family protein